MASLGRVSEWGFLKLRSERALTEEYASRCG